MIITSLGCDWLVGWLVMVVVVGGFCGWVEGEKQIDYISIGNYLDSREEQQPEV